MVVGSARSQLEALEPILPKEKGSWLEEPLPINSMLFLLALGPILSHLRPDLLKTPASPQTIGELDLDD